MLAMTIALWLLAMVEGMARDDDPPFGDSNKAPEEKPAKKKPKTKAPSRKKRAPKPARMPHDDGPPWM